MRLHSSASLRHWILNWILRSSSLLPFNNLSQRQKDLQLCQVPYSKDLPSNTRHILLKETAPLGSKTGKTFMKAFLTLGPIHPKKNQLPARKLNTGLSNC